MTTFEERPTDEASEDPPDTIPSLDDTGEARGPSEEEAASPGAGYPAGESARRPEGETPPGEAKKHPESVDKPTEHDEATTQASDPPDPADAAD